MRHILLLSGGKDSTALAIYMRDTHPDLPIEYLFCDTHKELPETYEYLAKVEAYLGQPIIRLTSDAGERGFDHWLQMKRGFLPSPNIRWCTQSLKLEPFERYIADDPVQLYIGIRADENRSGYISTKPNIHSVFPFKEHGINKNDVLQILQNSGVGIADYYKWRSRSGCYFCFFQRKTEWLNLKEYHEEYFELAMKYEKPELGYTWVQGESLSELIQPERADEIRSEAEKRRLQHLARRKPKTLAEIYTGEFDGDEDDQMCLMCHL